MAAVSNSDELRDYQKPYTGHHPIPTIKGFRKEQAARKDLPDPSDSDVSHGQLNGDGSEAENKNVESDKSDEGEYVGTGAGEGDETDVDEVVKDTSEALAAGKDAKGKRKDMKKRSPDGAERVVTDPVTHLPIRIHDFTADDLKNETADEKFQQREYARSSSTASGHKLEDDAAQGQRTHKEMERLFPPPSFNKVREQFANVHAVSLLAGLSVVVSMNVVANLFTGQSKGKSNSYLFNSGVYLGCSALTAGALWTVWTWNSSKIKRIWDSGVWEAERKRGRELAIDSTPESTHWLNSLLASIWPLVNPDLFVSLSDTLEDVMQASLPKLVRMISVEDIGQGSEAFRILGVRWLPKGAARRNVGNDGKLQKRNTGLKEGSGDRTIPGQGTIQTSEEKKKDENEPKGKRKEDEQEDENIAEGMQAEEGDFINLEVAFAYKARLSGHGMRTRSQNPHLYLAFYLPGNIKLPVWVELRGLIGTMRLRLQLTPDPPFFSICTMTFLGQPKVDLACVPLVKKGLNIMDLPLISNFVQSAVDAAMAEYVAPKSLTLDLKDMMMGDDFKKDTVARGVIMVRIIRALDFKEGDAGFGPLKDGSADGYVTVGWAKFGKTIFSTRIITDDMQPTWEETAFILVTPQELNVRERIRVQLWDSDRLSADDDLGRIEVDLEKIMTDSRSKGKMWDRTDGFRSLKAGEGMPGTLQWQVGYFKKTELMDEQLADQDPDVKTVQELKAKVYNESARKLREASKDESDEIEQQKAQDFKERQDELVIGAPPPRDYPSGIFSIVVHQIQGLELESLNKQGDQDQSTEDEQESGEDLPSSYCTIILNHQKVYKTRTKPKNSRPFFNAGTEKFIGNLMNSHVHISVRDARVHEDDPLIGIVDLPLSEVFEKRSQVNGMWPLAGGVGFGQMRISMVFRSVELKIPREITGWEYGTLDIVEDIKGNVNEDIKGCKIKIRTGLGSGKFKPDGQIWKSKSGKPVRLAVSKRNSSCVVVEFQTRSKSSMTTQALAFSVLWLMDISDDKDTTLTLPVWKGDLNKAQANVLEECGEKVGTVEIKLKFWRGLSGYHVRLAKKDNNVDDVMEVLDCANDVDDNQGLEDEDDSSSSSSDSDDDNALEQTGKRYKSKFTESKNELQSDGKRGTLDQLQDYKKHSKQLHRRNRGLMQWKAPRTLKWMQKKLDHGGQKVTGALDHRNQSAGIETEV